MSAQAFKGYRELSDKETALINEVKELGTQLGDLVFRLRTYTPTPQHGLPGPDEHDQPTLDQRWVSIGATHLQEGLMALTRGIAQPTTFA